MNVAQFRINERFKLSFSDLGENRGFEPMLIDNKGENTYTDIVGIHMVYDIDQLKKAIDIAIETANQIIRNEIIEANKQEFIPTK